MASDAGRRGVTTGALFIAHRPDVDVVPPRASMATRARAGGGESARARRGVVRAREARAERRWWRRCSREENFGFGIDLARTRARRDARAIGGGERIRGTCDGRGER